jgi:hypothetical protein
VPIGVVGSMVAMEMESLVASPRTFDWARGRRPQRGLTTIGGTARGGNSASSGVFSKRHNLRSAYPGPYIALIPQAALGPSREALARDYYQTVEGRTGLRE